MSSVKFSEKLDGTRLTLNANPHVSFSSRICSGTKPGIFSFDYDFNYTVMDTRKKSRLCFQFESPYVLAQSTKQVI